MGKVALKSIVCLTPGGGMSICWTIFLICGSNPISSILSASSKAKYLINCNDTLALSRRSTNLPGVATRMSTPLSSSRSCAHQIQKLHYTSYIVGVWDPSKKHVNKLDSYTIMFVCMFLNWKDRKSVM